MTTYHSLKCLITQSNLKQYGIKIYLALRSQTIFHDILTANQTIMLKIRTFLAFKLLEVVFIMLINVRMPTIVGILTFMSMIKLS